MYLFDLDLSLSFLQGNKILFFHFVSSLHGALAERRWGGGGGYSGFYLVLFWITSVS